MKTKTNIKRKIISSLLLIMTLLGFATVNGQGTIVAERNLNESIKKWHKIELVLAGPNLKEEAATYRNYRLDVTFVSPSNKIYKVAGFFDADGDPANSGATSGNVWKARFCAGEVGNWTYVVSFVRGADVAASLTGGTGGTAPDGQKGNFIVGSQDKTGKDFRAKGKLEYTGQHYLQFANGENFIKCGANSPEVLMGDKDFDGNASVTNSTGNVNHTPQASNWATGDPTWKSGKGKGIIGVVNYLSDKGVNGHYFLSMNIIGDGKHTFPFVDYNSPYTYDVSKLGQWELVFSQFDKKGLMIHFQTTETENTQYFENLEGGVTRTQFSIARKIYYRELIARFGHHMAITWNVGEENNAPFSQLANTESQRKAFADRLRALTPYKDNITVHNGGSGQNSAIDLYETKNLLGYANFTGTSLQLNFTTDNHANIKYWRDKSAATGKKWVISFDEPYASGSTTDLTTIRKGCVWSTLMAGGQMEWYHGGGADLSTTLDYNTYASQWATLGYAANFMNTYLSKDIHNMTPNDALITNSNYAIAEAGKTYLFYLKNGGNATVNLSSGAGSTFSVQWFNPSVGGALTSGAKVVGGSASTNIGNPPNNTTSDWVLLLKKISTSSNLSPTVSFTLPTSGAIYTAPATLVVSASATDSDGSITSVDLYLNNVLVRQDKISPYNWNETNQDTALSNLANGIYTLKAVATDNLGANSSVERAFTVGTVIDPTIPQLAFTLPINNANSGKSIIVKVSSTNTAITISNVILYLDGVLVRKESVVPYVWNSTIGGSLDAVLGNLSSGTHQLKAIATSSTGIKGTATISINVTSTARLSLENQSEEALITQVSSYPNPFSDKLTVTAGTNNLIYSTKIIGMNGSFFAVPVIISGSSAEFSTEYLSKGIYFVQLQTDNGLLIQKVIKE